MSQTPQAGPEPRFTPVGGSLAEQIDEAVRCRTTPLSRLLRLMAALDAQDGNDALRVQLRDRIGAPLDA